MRDASICQNLMLIQLCYIVTVKDSSSQEIESIVFQKFNNLTLLNEVEGRRKFLNKKSLKKRSKHFQINLAFEDFYQLQNFEFEAHFSALNYL